jgi:hypothetical protein
VKARKPMSAEQALEDLRRLAAEFAASHKRVIVGFDCECGFSVSAMSVDALEAAGSDHDLYRHGVVR